MPHANFILKKFFLHTKNPYNMMERKALLNIAELISFLHKMFDMTIIDWAHSTMQLLHDTHLQLLLNHFQIFNICVRNDFVSLSNRVLTKVVGIFIMIVRPFNRKVLRVWKMWHIIKSIDENDGGGKNVQVKN